MPIALLDKIRSEEKLIADNVEKKFTGNGILTDREIEGFKLDDETTELMGYFKRVMDGEEIPGFSIQDFLATPQAKVLIPRIIIGAARKAAEPMYLASKFFKTIRLKNGQAIQFPSFGVMRAHDVGEGQEIPQESIDWQTHSNSLISVKKAGIRVQYTDEVLRDTEFDIVGMMISEAGRAMARHKEQKAFKEFQKHSWVVFDNALAAQDPVLYKDAATTGVDFNNTLNGTMSMDDYLDLVLSMYNNGYTPTDVVMHPLAFGSFIKNGMTGVFTAPFDREAKRDLPGSVKIGTEAMQGKLPFGLETHLSPFAPVNKVNKSFDMFVVDKNNVGVQIVKDDIKTEEFRDPSRDITNVKLIERYGFGTHDEGRAICSARNISLAKGYPSPERTIDLSK